MQAAVVEVAGQEGASDERIKMLSTPHVKQQMMEPQRSSPSHSISVADSRRPMGGIFLELSTF